MRDAVQIDVVTPAEDYSLVDLSTLKALLGITDGSTDSYFDLTIPQASGIVAQECNQPFVIEEIQSSYWPTRDGWPWTVYQGLQPLQLVRYPVTEVASVVETIAGVATPLVEGAGYLLDAAKGQLIRLDHNGRPRAWSTNPIVVNFSAGYDEIPPNVVSVVVAILKGMLAARNRDPLLRSENIEGVYSAQYFFGSGPGSPGALPTSISGLLDQYRMPVLA